MTRAAAPPTLLQLQTAESVSTQLAALRSIKNELIGHDQRKEAYVVGGVIPALVQVLTSQRPAKAGSTEPNRSALNQTGSCQGSEEAEVGLQAILIVGSLAQGGPTFLAPIFASNVLSTLLAILSSPDCPQSFCLPILRLFNTIADRLPLQSQDQWPRDTRLPDLVFASEPIAALRRIIAQDHDSSRSTACIELGATLIGKLCTEEVHKTALAECGVLDALAVKVASFVVAQGFVLPGAEDHLQEPGALGDLPAPAPASARLAPILRAVTVIIEHSKWRAEHFLSSPGITTVFPRQVPGFAPSDVKRGPWGMAYLSGSAVPRHFGANPVDNLLPSFPLAHVKSSSSSPNFPPLGNAGSQRRNSHSFPTPFSLAETPTSEEDENSIVPWLLCILRSEAGMVRLMAARLVTVLFRLGLAKKHRVPMFGYLLVPILIRMLEKDFELPNEPGASNDGLITPTQRLKEEAPAVLANLVMDDQELQRHAVDGNALKRLSQLLKETYNPVSETLRPMWHAEEDSPARDPESLPSECRLGPPGYSPTLCHIMRYRESILKALAALVPFKDEYRKLVCENGVVPYIIDSLKPRPSDAPADTASMPKNTAADGNPTPTILAACGAARMLTRSVSVLRTSLIDAGVAAPLFVLIKHRDLEVQIAATAAICNLALDFSPMKEAIISGDIIPILCEHAHSSNTKLRIESLWALKHVVYNTPNDTKMKIVEFLGPAWIRQVISQDPVQALARRGLEDQTDQSSGIAMGRVNSAGEQVDILNPMEDVTETTEDFKMSDTMPPSKMSLDMFLPDARRQRRLVLHGNLEQSTQSRQDDIAVQEQTFDLLRNIICGSGAPEMIDYIFKEIGQDELLDALADNLRPRTIQLPHRRESSSRSLHVPVEILISVSALIIHIAAGLPRHRQPLVSHRDLLRSLTNYFNHSHREVRANCVWVVINLIYEEDQSDREGCRERATRLKALGFTDRLASLQNDSDLDIKERTKTAVHLLNSLVSA
ncbi:Armadillo [Penicillium hispanicum]|uniref:Armadillo n=1 Tax=Penicillium hispanicum TaxID=1080232 RepID=UPI002540EA82|nr:Armadillo [Penicillium hispanicum]KAJ5584166.1 Armadillo [Penicillium hispanicum]